MAKIEIDMELELSNEEEAQLDMHSFCNVMNIIFGDLQVLGKILGDNSYFEKSSAICSDILDAFKSKERTKESIKNIVVFKKTILTEIEAAKKISITDENHKRIFDETIKSLYNIIEVVNVRVQELLARFEVPSNWEEISENEIIDRLKGFADAIVLASFGRYGICYDRKSQTENDYLFDIEVKGLSGGNIKMPIIVNDCFRDLTANARKYTEPGGYVISKLIEDEEKLLLYVEDNGRGIPEAEIKDVVKYGVRGSNTSQKETKGGGFGLTKAYYVCKRFGGRMWIESAVGEGTKITIEIPKP